MGPKANALTAIVGYDKNVKASVLYMGAKLWLHWIYSRQNGTTCRLLSDNWLCL